MQRAADAYEFAVRVAHTRAAVVRALALWETWIVIASVLYIAGHFAYWETLAFRVIGQ